MAQPLPMLALSPTMSEGKISKWLKKVGDSIESGDPICEVETDKAVMEYESTVEGTLLHIVRGEGEQAAVGDAIGIIGDKGEDVKDLIEELKGSISKPKKAVAEAKPDSSSGSSSKSTEVISPPSSLPSIDTSSNGKIKSSPLARKLAEDNRINLSLVRGTGPEGRIVKRDIEAILSKGGISIAAQAAPAFQIPALSLADEKMPVSGKRKVIAQRLTESKFSAPHYYLRIAVKMDDLLATRKELNAKGDTKLSFNAFMMKLCAEAIKKYPIINSSWQGDTIIKHGSVDVGLAVAQEDGLITPVVRGCHVKGISNIESELKVLIDKALNNKLSPEEYTGATFTISNLGSFGIEEFTAIINPPGSVILALGEVKKEAVVNENDEIEIQSIMKMTLSCDHRVIDGAVGATFLKHLKDIMENPFLALV